jgi:hypothetical protein
MKVMRKTILRLALVNLFVAECLLMHVITDFKEEQLNFKEEHGLPWSCSLPQFTI